MGAGRLELFEEYRETGFDGKYERTTYYRLMIGEGDRNATATLEIEVETRTFPGQPQRESITRYQIGVEALAKLIEKAGTRTDG